MSISNNDALDTTQETTMETDEKLLLGSVGGKFSSKNYQVEIWIKAVVCKLCKKEFAYHWSPSSLRFHLNAKHVAAITDNAPSSGRQCHQSTLDEMTVSEPKQVNPRLTN